MFMLTEIVKHVATGQSESHLWWEWQIPVYLFLGGVVAGLMILTSWRVLRGSNEKRSQGFRLMAWMVPVLLSIGMLALFLDLSNRLNVLRFYMAFVPTSPMSWGAWILIAVYPVSVFFALSELPTTVRTWLGRYGIGKWLLGFTDWAGDEKRLRILSWSNLILGISLGIYTGILLSNLSARPLWNSAILGPLFLASGMSTAAALILLFGLDKKERHLIGRADAIFISVELVLLGLFILNLASGNAVQQKALGLLVSHGFAIGFWIFVVLTGLMTPLFIELWELRTRSKSRWIAPFLVLIGGFTLRWILVYAGQVTSW